MPIKKECEICKKIYYRKPSHAEKSKYCSRKCSDISKKGKLAWSNGLTKYTHPSLMRISISKLNEKNPQWKGDDVGYNKLHQWIRNRIEKPEICPQCKQKPAFDLSNISGEYKRDVNDFIYLCRSCHMKNDGRLEKLNYNKQVVCNVT